MTPPPNYIPHPLRPPFNPPSDLRDSVMRYNDCADKWEFWYQWGGYWTRGGGSAYLRYWMVVSYEDTWAEPFVLENELRDSS